VFTSLAKMKRLQLNFIYTNSINILILGLIGARIFFVIENYYLYFPDLSLNSWLGIFYFWDKGLSFLGGIIGIALSLIFYSRKQKEQTKKWLDILTISTIAGLIIGNIGRFLDGSSYGRETNLPWGILFESPSIKYAVPIHPTQLYAVLYSLIIAGVLFFFFAKTSFKAGIISVIGILSFFTMVFLEGFVRGDDVQMLLGLRIEQCLSILVFIIAAGSYIIYRYNIKRNSLKTEKNNNANT
jgi:phosphatidylglycerol:prolipoprotein diacylglycerol transferase